MAAATAGIALLTVGQLLDARNYHEVASGPSPLSIPAPTWLATAWGIAAAAIFFAGTLIIAVLSIVRLSHARPPQRQQLAWLVAVVVPMFLLLLVPAPEWLFDMTLYLIPIAIGVGVFRHNLLGIEVVLRRGLVYGALTAAVISVYLLVSAAGGSRLGHGPVPGVVAAALVAVGLAPMRERLQHAVDRLVYGERRDPMRAVTRLGDQVAAAQEQDLLPAVLVSVTKALRAPGATVLALDGRVLATVGTPAPGVALTLTVGGRQVGTLQVAARSRGEVYAEADRRLLGALLPQVAVVVRALDLAEALEAERDRVVAATRTERDRLRRDLHDGLGPSLSGVGLGLQALDDAIALDDHTTARELATLMRTEIASAVGEVRRILDNLRPATLDETDLASAVRRHAVAAGSVFPVHVTVSPHLPPLQPDVETAAYRIAQEALTNVVKHARASHATVDLAAADGTLRVQVVDDGHGLHRTDSATDGPGVGLASMRHRAEALGGALTVDSDERGTTITATLPLQPT